MSEMNCLSLSSVLRAIQARAIANGVCFDDNFTPLLLQNNEKVYDQLRICAMADLMGLSDDQMIALGKKEKLKVKIDSESLSEFCKVSIYGQERALWLSFGHAGQGGEYQSARDYLDDRRRIHRERSG